MPPIKIKVSVEASIEICSWGAEYREDVMRERFLDMVSKAWEPKIDFRPTTINITNEWGDSLCLKIERVT